MTLLQKSLYRVILPAALLFCGSISWAESQSPLYRKSTEGDDVVKNKLYPKKSKVELNVPNLGAILNQSYIESYVINGGLNYFPNEVWGFGVEGSYVINKDKKERQCIEYFYNDPAENAVDECGDESAITSLSPDKQQVTNYGPAYVPIRETKYMFGGVAIWNPVYGKQIFFLSATNYFDLFFTGGAGLAISTFYPESTTLRANYSDGTARRSRGDFPATGSTNAEKTPGAKPGESIDGLLLYGEEGRPDPTDSSNPYVTLGVGQRFHFAKRFSLRAELRNFTLLGTPGGFDNFFTLSGGLAVRF